MTGFYIESPGGHLGRQLTAIAKQKAAICVVQPLLFSLWQKQNRPGIKAVLFAFSPLKGILVFATCVQLRKEVTRYGPDGFSPPKGILVFATHLF